MARDEEEPAGRRALVALLMLGQLVHAQRERETEKEEAIGLDEEAALVVTVCGQSVAALHTNGGRAAASERIICMRPVRALNTAQFPIGPQDSPTDSNLLPPAQLEPNLFVQPASQPARKTLLRHLSPAASLSLTHFHCCPTGRHTTHKEPRGAARSSARTTRLSLGAKRLARSG